LNDKGLRKKPDKQSHFPNDDWNIESKFLQVKQFDIPGPEQVKQVSSHGSQLDVEGLR
jgi:hypothetical protein